MSAEFAKAYTTRLRCGLVKQLIPTAKKKGERKGKKHDVRELSQDTKYSQFWLVRNFGDNDEVCSLTKIM